MTGTVDKIKGYTNEAVGTVKQGVGRLVGSEEMEAKGAAQELKGQAQVTASTAKEAVDDTVDEMTEGSTADKIRGAANDAAGNIKQAVGRMTGSEKMQAEGAAQELKGDAQTAKGETKEAVEETTDRYTK